jgi:two-component system C4-dicarboxylate transport sensor histidine kinase DctB
VYNSFVPESTAALVPHAWAFDDLVRINRWVLVSSVVRGTVHSVNNILQTIGGQAEMLGQRPGSEDDVRRRAERIVSQTGRAAGYMRELSAVGRTAPETADRVDVRLGVDRAFALREYDFMRASIAFEVTVEVERLPACRIGPQALAVVLLNLLLNAEQALVRVPDARIRVRLRHVPGHVLVSVLDNGPGIPPDIRASMFEPFVTSGRPGATLGLGLPVSRHLVEAHGGRLEFVEDDAPGARFDLELKASG